MVLIVQFYLIHKEYISPAHKIASKKNIFFFKCMIFIIHIKNVPLKFKAITFNIKVNNV